MKIFNTSSILALTLALLSACAPANQNKTSAVSADEIIGGKTVMPGSQVSKQVFMLFGISKDGTYICTATLITQQHILTAAHCVESAKRMFAVFAVDGIKKLKTGNPQNDPNIVPVTDASIYPTYGGAKNGTLKGVDAGDIAVLKLAKPAPDDVKVTKLYSSSLRKKQILVAAGYGTESGVLHTGSGLLRDTTVVVEEPLIGKSEFIINQTNGRGICSGDSGGPSFVQTTFGELVQVGITSRGDDKCLQAGVYTLVPAYLDWINATVRALN